MAGARRASAAAVAVLLAALALPGAHAGQVRVTVGPGTTFSPRVVDINLGDHVVWVWEGALGHSVASGDSSTNSPDALFGTGLTSSGLKYSWLSTQVGNHPYYCDPHAPAMAGRVVVHSGNSINVSDFRITEVQFNAPGGLDRIEIANLGAADGNLGRYRLAIVGSGAGVEIPLNDFTLASGARVTIHANTAGTNDAANIFLAALGNLGDATGSVALYAPHSIAPANGVSNPDMMLDFVQWGAAGQANEGIAVLASLWDSGSIDNVAPNHSIEYCMTSGFPHGVANWKEISSPNFGGNGNCATPTATETWGRLKVLYRP